MSYNDLTKMSGFQGPLLLNGLILAWKSNCTHYEMWDEMILPSQTSTIKYFHPMGM